MKNILVLFILSISIQISFAKNSNTGQYKTALIIDNNDYGGSDILPNNSGNITELAASLQGVGFSVKVLSNPKADELNDSVHRFYNDLPASDCVSLLYYGGQISSDYGELASIIPVDKASRNLLSIQKIADLSNEKSGRNNQHFLLFDAFFTTKTNYKDIVQGIKLGEGAIISTHDAKPKNLRGEASNYLPSLIAQIFESQPLKSAFENIDATTESSSRVNSNAYSYDIFREYQVAATMVLSALEMPEFPFPPPKASANYTFDKNLFSGINNLTQSSERIENALKKSGYYEKSYYQIPNGYALVTRIEKIEPDGTPAVAEERWNVSDTGSSSSFDLLSYFKSLFFANEGHYRIIVFLVTSDNVQMTDRIMLMSEGQDFLSSGLNRLPSQFDSMPFTENHYCTALIYEWYKVEHEEAKFMEPSKFLGQYHLAKNKFVEYLEEEK
jgi:hypothetical protein